MHRLRLAALAVTVSWPVLAGGGFGARAQLVFIMLAAGLLGMLIATSSGDVTAAVAQPTTVTLLLIGALSVISCAWTIGGMGAAIRSGLLCLAFAVIMTAALLLSREDHGAAIAAGIAVIAAGEALVGLAAVSTHTLPEAERLAGVWRPGGTFEYQPALALLEVGALPILAHYLEDQRRWLAAAAAAAAVLAGATLALADDRLALGLATVLVVGLLAWARPQAQRFAAMITLIASLAAGAAIGALMLDRTVSLGAPAVGLVACLPIVAVALTGSALAVGLRQALCRLCRRLALTAVPSRVLMCGVIALGALAVATAGGVSGVHSAGFLHGRPQEWWAALQTWSQRPVLGFGAGTYYLASLPHQTVAISSFAHNLPLQWAAELGTAGLVLGIALYALVGRDLLRRRREATTLLFLPLVAAFMVSNLVDWTWYIPGVTVAWAMGLGAVCGGQSGMNADQSSPRRHSLPRESAAL